MQGSCATRARAPEWAARLCDFSMLLYVLWLLLPAAQTTGRAATGALAVALYAVGTLGDTAYLRARWRSLCLRALCALLIPLVLWFCLGRGGVNLPGFYVQQVMFWFPPIFCATARERGDARLWRFVKPLLMAAMAVTTLTTLFWLVEGMLRGGKVYAYARSLGFGEPGNEAYLKELMLKNIGGYDFIYASVLSLPVVCWLLASARGARRLAVGAFLAAQTAMIVLSQYSYAIVFTALILFVEGFSALLRALWRARRRALGMGVSMLLSCLPLLLGFLAREPLVAFAASLCRYIGFQNVAFSMEQLLAALQGGATDEAARLVHYQEAIGGFLRSPLLGSLVTGERRLSYHSEFLDMLSALGVVGAAALGAMIWATGRGLLRGLAQCPARAQLTLQLLALAALGTLGTVFYSRDVSLIVSLCCFFFIDGGKERAEKNA